MSPTDPGHRQSLSILAAKYLKYLALTKNASASTSKSYANDLAQALEPIEPVRLKVLPSGCVNVEPKCGKNFQTSWSVEQLLELANLAMTRWRSLAPSSRNRKVACLRGFFRWLYEQEIIQRDISSHLVSPKVPEKLPHFLSVDEALHLIRTLNQQVEQTVGSENHRALRDRALVLLLYGGGLRVSEACNLKWKNVNSGGAGTLRIRGKGDKERLVSVPRSVISALNHLRSHNHPFVFGPQPLHPRTAYQIVRDWGSRAGLIKPLHPHALRHSYATHLLTSGSDLRILQELLGHESLAATQKYTHLSLDALARTLESHHPLSTVKVVGKDDSEV